MQCYYGENNGTFQSFLRYMAQFAPPPNTPTTPNRVNACNATTFMKKCKTSTNIILNVLMGFVYASKSDIICRLLVQGELWQRLLCQNEVRVLARQSSGCSSIIIFIICIYVIDDSLFW